MKEIELLTKIKNEFVKYEHLKKEQKEFINLAITKGIVKKGHKNYLEISDIAYNQYIQEQNQVPTV
jgi:hypothetical protein